MYYYKSTHILSQQITRIQQHNNVLLQQYTTFNHIISQEYNNIMKYYYTNTQIQSHDNKIIQQHNNVLLQRNQIPLQHSTRIQQRNIVLLQKYILSQNNKIIQQHNNALLQKFPNVITKYHKNTTT